MTFLRTRRSQFIAWMVIYALAVALMASKGADESGYLVWGLALGAGAGVATCTSGPLGRWKRLGVVTAWLGLCWLLGFAILGGEVSRGSSLWDRAESVTIVTLICGGPALLALLVWIFRRPKYDSPPLNP
ncbi:MAG: hypothetical protein ABIP81_03020 [Terriglobales bacterium]